MKLIINNLELALKQPEMFAECIDRAASYTHNVEVFPMQPTLAGIIEWHLVIGTKKKIFVTVVLDPDSPDFIYIEPQVRVKPTQFSKD